MHLFSTDQHPFTKTNRLFGTYFCVLENRIGKRQKKDETMDKIYYERIKAGFESKSAGKIISTAKQLQKKYISGFEDTIVSILENRYRSNKSWEVQSELIKIIGKERIDSALPLIKEIVAKNIDFDMVTIQAATAYLRMTRKDTSDVNPIISMFGHIGFSVGEGFLACLGTDLMVPPKSDQDKLITYFRDFGNPLPLGHVDPRFGLVLAAENWNTPEAKEFIKRCSLSSDSKMSIYAKKVLAMD